MFQTTTFVLALSALAFASPVPQSAEVNLEKRGCPSSLYSKPNTGVIDTIYRVALSRGVNSKVMLAMFETAAVESNYNNLSCGDQDSVGVFQQRPSQNWGSVGQILNIEYSTNKFLDGAISMDKKHPDYSAGKLAQSVQISEYPTRYDEQESRARSILAQAKARNGGGGQTSGNGGAINVGTNPNKGNTGSSKPKPSKGSSSSSASKPKNLAKGTVSSGCKKYHTVKKGDVCGKLAKNGGISLSKFYSLNKGVHSGSCNNLQIGQAYCVA
ncbi:hypothetical protein EXIGLDRAFT_720411 [Exidia glandulosa HHB12029]|uniref:LysM domain-containing protein n=1 Tax=Exidia glandulosa HHB12029 TaxID=1314781 RepID=A0A165NIG8_EXIGL|nr:hypothetical protein EXIGLDRAFT_720411 [Exidia glandulosa HHB12029]